jgi:hypothetical protein
LEGEQTGNRHAHDARKASMTLGDETGGEECGLARPSLAWLGCNGSYDWTDSHEPIPEN